MNKTRRLGLARGIKILASLYVVAVLVVTVAALTKMGSMSFWVEDKGHHFDVGTWLGHFEVCYVHVDYDVAGPVNWRRDGYEARIGWRNSWTGESSKTIAGWFSERPVRWEYYGKPRPLPNGIAFLVALEVDLWLMLLPGVSVLVALHLLQKRQAHGPYGPKHVGHCMTCGYDLRGNASRCPECGVGGGKTCRRKGSDPLARP